MIARTARETLLLEALEEIQEGRHSDSCPVFYTGVCGGLDGRGTICAIFLVNRAIAAVHALDEAELRGGIGEAE